VEGLNPGGRPRKKGGFDPKPSFLVTRVGKLLPPPVITGYCHGYNRPGNNLLAIMATTSWQKWQKPFGKNRNY